MNSQNYENHQNSIEKGSNSLWEKAKIYGKFSSLLFGTLLATDKLDAQCNVERDTIYKTLIYHPDTQVPEDVKEFTKEYHNELFGQIQSPQGNPVGVAISEVTMPREIADIFDTLGVQNAVLSEINLAILQKESHNNLSYSDQQLIREWYQSVRESHKADELQTVIPGGYEGSGGVAYSFQKFEHDQNNESVNSIVKTGFTKPGTKYHQHLYTRNDTIVQSKNLVDKESHETAHNLGGQHKNAVEIKYIDPYGNEAYLLTTNVAAKTGYYTGVPYFTRRGLVMDSLRTPLMDYRDMASLKNVKLYNEVEDETARLVPMDGNADIMERNIATVFEKNPYVCASTPIEEVDNISSSIDIYPNPAQDRVTIDYPEYETKSIIVSDMSGKVLKIGTYDNNEIDISNLQNGMYILRLLTNDNKVAVKKFAKQ